jgi:hypothetical protein
VQNAYTIQQLFTDKVLRIPDYQRGYAWNQQQLEDFWEDLEYLGPDKDHYTGTIILHEQKEEVLDEEGKQNRVFHVVDGQQRLTTVVILLNCIRTQLEKFDRILAAGIKKSYIQFNSSNRLPAFKLELNRDCQDYWANSVLGEPVGPQGPRIASQERLRLAKDYLAGRVSMKLKERGSSGLAWLRDSLFRKLTQQLKITQYIVEGEEEVGVIFEVMNDRGKPLSELEKVKNYLMYLAYKLQIRENPLSGQVNGVWTNIFERLMRAGLEGADDENRLLRSQWVLAYAPDAKEWDGSKSIKKQFQLKSFDGRHKILLGNLTSYTRVLNDCLSPFCDAYDPRGAESFKIFSEPMRSAIRKWQEKLLRISVVAPFLPLLIACRLRFPDDSGKYLLLLQLCEKFAFRTYRIAGRRSNAGQARLFRLSFRLWKGDITFDEAISDVHRYAVRYCPGKTFREFAQMDQHEGMRYGWRGLKYLLYEYEEHLSGKREVNLTWQTVSTDKSEKTIEHILPQTPIDKYWKKRFNRVARARLTDDIGNLCLTVDNSVYGRKPFPVKKGSPGSSTPCYANANLMMERELSKFSDWDESFIVKRRDKIIEWYLSRWHLDEIDADVSQDDAELDDIESDALEDELT